MTNLNVKFVDARDILGRVKCFHYGLQQYLIQSESIEHIWRKKSTTNFIFHPVKLVRKLEIFNHGFLNPTFQRGLVVDVGLNNKLILLPHR
jgi:hypothetical protein